MNFNDPIIELIDLNIANLTKTLIKCDRDAEKKQVQIQHKTNVNMLDPKIKFDKHVSNFIEPKNDSQSFQATLPIYFKICTRKLVGFKANIEQSQYNSASR